MGRRALPKISADISHHFLSKEDLPETCDSKSLFGNGRPLEIEVGSGKGLFLQQVCAAQPLHNYLGIEVVGKYARFAAARVAQTGCDNVKMLHGDAIEFFRERIRDNSIEAIHVYFPDPWWKKRHRRRRVMNDEFIGSIQRSLRQGGRLHFWTDVREYFESTLELIGQISSMDGPFEVPAVAPMHDLDYRTHFERRVRKNDLPVYRAEFSKPSWQVQVSTDSME